MNKLLVICGPTATGKTNLGVRLARRFKGEIVSADSRQVYKGIDVITGKDLPANSKFQIPNSKLKVENKRLNIGYRLKDGIPIWLVDVVDPDYIFNVAEYKTLADKVIDDIRSRSLLPIVVGGTGLYIRALTVSLDLLYIQPNKILRKKFAKSTREELAQYLKKIDLERWEKMNDSDRQNPRRLIRAIEISHAIKKEGYNAAIYANRTRDDILMIGLAASTDSLYKLVDKRVEERVKQGAVEEAFELFQKGYRSDLPSLSTSGYRPLLYYNQQIISLETAIQKWKYSEHAYARRQLIWFKRDKRIQWFDVTERDYIRRIEETVGKWYTGQ